MANCSPINRAKPVDLRKIRFVSALLPLIGVSGRQLRVLVETADRRYREWDEMKPNGEPRHLAAPIGTLRLVQDRLKPLLTRLPVDPAAHGWVKGRSRKTFTACHVGREIVVVRDIQSFFGNVSALMVRKALEAEGVAPRIAVIVAHLCTRNDSLPQGTSTSPILANLVAKPLDKQLRAIAASFGFRYTRYGDDLLFSGSKGAAGLAAAVENAVRAQGFEIALHKSRICEQSERQIAVDVVLNRKQNVRRALRKDIRRKVALAEKVSAGRLATESLEMVGNIASLQGRVGNWCQFGSRSARKVNDRLKRVRRRLNL